MSMDDEQMRTLCPACECWVDDYGQGCAVIYESEKYHPKCAPDDRDDLLMHRLKKSLAVTTNPRVA